MRALRIRAADVLDLPDDAEPGRRSHRRRARAGSSFERTMGRARPGRVPLARDASTASSRARGCSPARSGCGSGCGTRWSTARCRSGLERVAAAADFGNGVSGSLPTSEFVVHQPRSDRAPVAAAGRRVGGHADGVVLRHRRRGHGRIATVRRRRAASAAAARACSSTVAECSATAAPSAAVRWRAWLSRRWRDDLPQPQVQLVEPTPCDRRRARRRRRHGAVPEDPARRGRRCAAIIAKLEDPVTDLVRRDATWERLGLTDADAATEDQVVALLLAHKELMQRPIVVKGDRAIIGRPKDRVRELLAGLAPHGARPRAGPRIASSTSSSRIAPSAATRIERRSNSLTPWWPDRAASAPPPISAPSTPTAIVYRQPLRSSLTIQRARSPAIRPTTIHAQDAHGRDGSGAARRRFGRRDGGTYSRATWTARSTCATTRSPRRRRRSGWPLLRARARPASARGLIARRRSPACCGAPARSPCRRSPAWPSTAGSSATSRCGSGRR